MGGQLGREGGRSACAVTELMKKSSAGRPSPFAAGRTRVINIVTCRAGCQSPRGVPASCLGPDVFVIYVDRSSPSDGAGVGLCSALDGVRAGTLHTRVHTLVRERAGHQDSAACRPAPQPRACQPPAKALAAPGAQGAGPFLRTFRVSGTRARSPCHVFLGPDDEAPALSSRGGVAAVCCPSPGRGGQGGRSDAAG